MALLVMAAWRDSTPNSHLRQSVEGGGAGASTADPRSMTSRSDARARRRLGRGPGLAGRLAPLPWRLFFGHSFASAQSTSGVKSVLMTSMASGRTSREGSRTGRRVDGNGVERCERDERDEVTSPWRVWGEFLLFPPRSGNYTRA